MQHLVNWVNVQTMNWVPYLKPIKCKCNSTISVDWTQKISIKKLYCQRKIYNAFKHKQNILSKSFIPLTFEDFWLVSAPGNGRKTGTVSDPDVPGSEDVEEETLCFVLNNALSCKLNIYGWIKIPWERWVVKFKYANDTWYSNPCHNRALTDCTIIIHGQ